MGEHIGNIGEYEVWWNSETGSVWVGDDECEDTAEDKDSAMKVARAWVERYGRN